MAQAVAIGLLSGLGCASNAAAPSAPPVHRVEAEPEPAARTDSHPDTQPGTAASSEPGMQYGASDCCAGRNECKGQGACAVASVHDCAGKNECKGKGGRPRRCPEGERAKGSCAGVTAPSSGCCRGLNDCKGKGGCAEAGSHACAGQNECKGKGGCKAHCPH